MPAPKGDNLSFKSLVKQYMGSGIDPGQAFGFGEQAANAVGSYRDTLALLRMNRQTMKSQFREQRRDIRSQRQIDMRSAAAAAAGRGVLGSSVDVQTRQAVRSGAASQVIAARDALTQGLINSRLEQSQANRDLYATLASIAGARAAAKATAATNNYTQGIFDSLTSGGGGGGGGGGGRWYQALEGAKGVEGLARRIERLNGGLFDVWQLEGFQGGVTGPHSGPESKHHVGLAGDINTTKRNNTPFEQRKVERLFRILERIYGNKFNGVYEQDPDTGGGHGHFEVSRRRF